MVNNGSSVNAARNGTILIVRYKAAIRKSKKKLRVATKTQASNTSVLIVLGKSKRQMVLVQAVALRLFHPRMVRIQK